MIKIINTSRQISAPLDQAWEIISNMDGEPQYLRGLNAVYNVSKKGNALKREVTVDPRDLKGHQTVALYPKKSIELTLSEGPMISTRIVTLIPYSSDNEIKTTTRIHVCWDIKLSDNIPPLFRGIVVREHIAKATEEEALDRIANAV
jgi:hypothetical protein